MDNSTMTRGLVSTWVTTVDSRGRSRLEAHWRPAAAPVEPSVQPSTLRPVAADSGRPGDPADRFARRLTTAPTEPRPPRGPARPYACPRKSPHRE